MAQMDENTVAVTHQVKVDQRSSFENPEGKGRACVSCLPAILSPITHRRRPLAGIMTVIITTAFWTNPYNEVIRAYAEKHGHPLVELSDMGSNPEMKAYGLFERKGVAVHPGDKGMAEIARRIMEVF